MNTFFYISAAVEANIVSCLFLDFLLHNTFDRHIRQANLVQWHKNPQIHCHLARYCYFHIAKMYDLLYEICKVLYCIYCIVYIHILNPCVATL